MIRFIDEEFLKASVRQIDDYEKRTPVNYRTPLRQVFKSSLSYQFEKRGSETPFEDAESILEFMYEIAEFCERLEPRHERRTYLDYIKSKRRLQESCKEQFHKSDREIEDFNE